MGLFDDKKTDRSVVNAQDVSQEMARAEENSRKASEDTRESIYNLGLAVYEAEKDTADSYYSSQIREIKKRKDNEKLWHQYTLTLDGKMQCEKCGAIITSDSAFCNKCGATVEPLDFTHIGMGNAVSDNAGNANVCPTCGTPLAEGAVFCEKCGTKIDAVSDAGTVNTVSNVPNNNCPTCGAPLVAGAVFCEKCGTKLG